MKKEEYIEINGTFYKKNTPSDLIEILENARQNKTRLIFDFGDTKTKKSWGEVCDISGYIGRSTGSIKIPLLIHNKRSLGGGALLTDCILSVRESEGKKILYKLN